MYLQMLKQERLKRVRRQMQQAGEDIVGSKTDQKNYQQELPISVNKLQQEYNQLSKQYPNHMIAKPETSAQNRVGYLSSVVDDAQRPPRHHLNKENSQLQNIQKVRYQGPASIVELGRIESQRLLLERYRRLDIDGSNHIGQEQPLYLDRHQYYQKYQPR